MVEIAAGLVDVAAQLLPLFRAHAAGATAATGSAIVVALVAPRVAAQLAAQFPALLAQLLPLDREALRPAFALATFAG